MSYVAGLFAKKEDERRVLRNKMRDQFFAELGIERLVDPNLLEVDGKEQYKTVLELIEIAKSIHDKETSGLEALQSSLTALMFGIPVFSPPRIPQITLDSITPENMQKTHFDLGWMDWLDD